MLGSYNNFVNMNAQNRKALQEKEEWLKELHRFDFDRIHSTTHLRTY